MIKKETVCFCAPKPNSPTRQSFYRFTSAKSRFEILLSAACALLCLIAAAPASPANSKDKRSRNAETRPRRAAVEKKANPKLAGKSVKASRRESASSRRETANQREKSSQRETVSKRESASKRELAGRREREIASRREAANKRESVNRTATSPYLRKTVIVSSTQDNNRAAASRPGLVNDIVIISEAPVTGNLPSTRKFEGSTNANMPSIWPVAGNLGKSGFGIRRNPFGGMSTEFHKGQDISAPYGTPVIATADGVVVIAGWLRGYGQVVYIDHGNGISTRYGHLSRLDVIVGQTIKRGQQLGLVGSTGRSTGPHLHYEVRLDGQATNPLPYLPNLPAPTLATAPGIQ